MKETQILDDLDINLIAILRKDGRAPVAKLSQILGVSRGTVQNRLDRLLSSGAILGFTIRAHHEVEQNLIKAIMMIEVAGKSTSQVIQKLRGLPELTHMHTTNGAWDLIANIQTTTLTEFDLVLRRVRTTPGVLNSETSILLSSI
ncbi:Regulatory protein AsnC [Paraglaciecola mesophila]|uniref:Regulatory protein AsnC n=1 Tax=Paraglaciecola mesophila TaxID=197222 RepID=A0A857JGX4_9ALTE|nr:Lrp/AsnC family transcriptional regulator [Paraglaciecola mesophila]QHJ10926.1 Regulatory protein AsnC [Paraglaciecola mesophila]